MYSFAVICKDYICKHHTLYAEIPMTSSETSSGIYDWEVCCKIAAH